MAGLTVRSDYNVKDRKYIKHMIKELSSDTVRYNIKKLTCSVKGMNIESIKIVAESLFLEKISNELAAHYTNKLRDVQIITLYRILLNCYMEYGVNLNFLEYLSMSCSYLVES